MVTADWRRRLFEQADEAYAALQADPEAWAAELAEREAWDTSLGDGLDDDIGDSPDDDPVTEKRTERT